jgi:hypothetical protein
MPLGTALAGAEKLVLIFLAAGLGFTGALARGVTVTRGRPLASTLGESLAADVPAAAATSASALCGWVLGSPNPPKRPPDGAGAAAFAAAGVAGANVPSDVAGVFALGAGAGEGLLPKLKNPPVAAGLALLLLVLAVLAGAVAAAAAAGLLALALLLLVVLLAGAALAGAGALLAGAGDENSPPNRPPLLLAELVLVLVLAVAAGFLAAAGAGAAGLGAAACVSASDKYINKRHMYKI